MSQVSTHTNLTVSRETRDKIDAVASAEERTLSATVNRAIDEYIANHKIKIADAPTHDPAGQPLDASA